MIQNATEFGRMVARARKAPGITQRGLALASNAGERFIVDLEAGKPTAQPGNALAARAAVVRLEDVSGNLAPQPHAEREAFRPNGRVYREQVTLFPSCRMTI